MKLSEAIEAAGAKRWGAIALGIENGEQQYHVWMQSFDRRFTSVIQAGATELDFVPAVLLRHLRRTMLHARTNPPPKATNV